MTDFFIAHLRDGPPWRISIEPRGEQVKITVDGPARDDGDASGPRMSGTISAQRFLTLMIEAAENGYPG